MIAKRDSLNQDGCKNSDVDNNQVDANGDQYSQTGYILDVPNSLGQSGFGAAYFVPSGYQTTFQPVYMSILSGHATTDEYASMANGYVAVPDVYQLAQSGSPGTPSRYKPKQSSPLTPSSHSHFEPCTWYQFDNTAYAITPDATPQQLKTRLGHYEAVDKDGDHGCE